MSTTFSGRDLGELNNGFMPQCINRWGYSFLLKTDYFHYKRIRHTVNTTEKGEALIRERNKKTVKHIPGLESSVFKDAAFFNLFNGLGEVPFNRDKVDRH